MYSNRLYIDIVCGTATTVWSVNVKMEQKEPKITYNWPDKLHHLRCNYLALGNASSGTPPVRYYPQADDGHKYPGTRTTQKAAFLHPI